MSFITLTLRFIISNRNSVPIKFGKVNELAQSSSSRDTPHGQQAAPLCERHKPAALRTSCVHRNGTYVWGFQEHLLQPKSSSSNY